MLSGLRRLPWMRVLAVAELALTARRHLRYLTPAERRRLVELMRRPTALTPTERDELRALAVKLEPRAFAGAVVDAVSPVRLPNRLTRGPRRRRR